MIVFPNAKINLGLNVIRKRSDGYHDIESVLWPIKLCDILEIIPAPDKQFRFYKSGASLPDDWKPNLCEQAWQLLHNRFGIDPVHVFLHKIIPAGSGLGGGSSDAAFTIKALNQFFSLDQSKENLANLALMIGSDCPFFIENKPMIARSRGETLEPISLPLNGLNLLLIVPNVHVSTAFAYSKVKPREPQKPLREILSFSVNNWQNNLQNDFEEPVFDEFPSLREIKEQLLRSGAIYASMSGSGSSVFGLFENPISDSVQEAFAGYFFWKEQLA
ncbi:MAG TPA: 4-(cytidine 5'-diphospho)-2-C-methyl-D-erythritol kinase [Bacteroidales bacterium]|nr:4-(cytidine 5'-diphospho)-2-C-methyl-D-erythritol kinase [Bacteroidales bacterium]